jgi:hypothetical protein
MMAWYNAKYYGNCSIKNKSGGVLILFFWGFMAPFAKFS